MSAKVPPTSTPTLNLAPESDITCRFHRSIYPPLGQNRSSKQTEPYRKRTHSTARRDRSILLADSHFLANECVLGPQAMQSSRRRPTSARVYYRHPRAPSRAGGAPQDTPLMRRAAQPSLSPFRYFVRSGASSPHAAHRAAHGTSFSTETKPWCGSPPRILSIACSSTPISADGNVLDPAITPYVLMPDPKV